LTLVALKGYKSGTVLPHHTLDGGIRQLFLLRYLKCRAHCWIHILIKVSLPPTRQIVKSPDSDSSSCRNHRKVIRSRFEMASKYNGGYKMFERILIALKFGPASMHALNKGLEVARLNNAELHIFHALDYLLQDLEESDPKLLAVKHETEHRFKTEVEPLLGNLKNVYFKCRPADPALEVCKMARDINADLIVLGCHQLPEKMCMGRIDYVGMTILEKAPCPVILVPLCE